MAGQDRFEELKAEYRLVERELEDAFQQLEDAELKAPKSADFRKFREHRAGRLADRIKAIQGRIDALCAELAELQKKDASVPRVGDTAQLAALRRRLAETRERQERIDHARRRGLFKELFDDNRRQELEYLDGAIKTVVRQIRLIEREQDQAEAAEEEFQG